LGRFKLVLNVNQNLSENFSPIKIESVHAVRGLAAGVCAEQPEQQKWYSRQMLAMLALSSWNPFLNCTDKIVIQREWKF